MSATPVRHRMAAYSSRADVCCVNFSKNVGDARGCLGVSRWDWRAAFVIEGCKSSASSNVAGHSRLCADDLIILSEDFIRAMHDPPAAGRCWKVDSLRASIEGAF
uniref:Uncharacterized protein n=1 Tax=Ralstonia solanacearum TaxID=305 RepID=A0A0S4VXE6_RALSL|nr:conserved protein of unknown function [Ralstonia solanacearum]CUV39203.1 conserved protein of unknown function [Ralstonia solanacearum]